MAVEVKVPQLGESINEVEIAEWIVAEGDFVELDAPLVEIESEKASVEVPAPATGVLITISKQKGETATVGEVIGLVEAGDQQIGEKIQSSTTAQATQSVVTAEAKADQSEACYVMPAAKRVLAENKLSKKDVTPTGPGGRLLKEDALKAVAESQREKVSSAQSEGAIAAPVRNSGNRSERKEPMTPIRRTIAKRLVQAQQEAALLTTFNEADMSAVKKLRAELGEVFEKQHGVRLGFMSFFVKAAVAALKKFPQINASIDDNTIVYHDYCDIGIAIGGGKGLVVPVIRNAEDLGFSQIEQQIALFGAKAKTGKLTIEELTGGTFTISNGGVYGSMLSTPIINPPQSGVLGLHAIKDRPVVVDHQVVIRPIMYLALTYDHRMVDGREAVTFLREIKESIENPSRLLLEV